MVRDNGKDAVILACLVPIRFVMVVAKLGSYPSAVASSLGVYQAAGLELTK